MENIFRPVYRELTVEEKQKMDEIKQKAHELYLLMDLVVPVGERSDKGRCVNLGKTKLEEAVMWVIKGLTL